MSRVILCVDMDAFFASVEQRTNPRLRGKPIGVIGSAKRTVITTASYEARKFGVKTGMNIREAKQACPSIILVVGNNEKYTDTCRKLQGIYLQFTPDVEIYSIDEAFLDVSTTHHLFKGPGDIGRCIKKIIRETFGIACTVGIAPNILLAKLASDLGKPDGLMQVVPGEIEHLLEDLPVTELWGIGRRIADRLAALGIKTCGELGRTPASLLRSKFGITGETLREMGRGICNRPVQTRQEEPKSIGHSMTLPQDIGGRAEIEAYLLKLSEMVGRRARRNGYQGKTVSLVIRYADFETFSRQTRRTDSTSNTHDIYQTVLHILDAVRLKERVRLLGVCLSELTADPRQIPLIAEERRQREILRAMDQVNDRYGDFTVTWASYAMMGKESGVISPAWRPSGVRSVKVK